MTSQANRRGSRKAVGATSETQVAAKRRLVTMLSREPRSNAHDLERIANRVLAHAEHAKGMAQRGKYPHHRIRLIEKALHAWEARVVICDDPRAVTVNVCVPNHTDARAPKDLAIPVV